MRIRKALPSDVRRLYLLEKGLFSEENFPLSRQSFYYHIRYNLLYVAQSDEGEIAGYVLALIRRKDAKIYSLGVALPYRGSQVAMQLMQTLSAQLQSLGFKRILLEVRTDNKGAVSLYKKLGFSVRKTIRAFYRDGCDAYVMEAEYADKKLSGSLQRA